MNSPYAQRNLPGWSEIFEVALLSGAAPLQSCRHSPHSSRPGRHKPGGADDSSRARPRYTFARWCVARRNCRPARCKSELEPLGYLFNSTCGRPIFRAFCEGWIAQAPIAYSEKILSHFRRIRHYEVMFAKGRLRLEKWFCDQCCDHLSRQSANSSKKVHSTFCCPALIARPEFSAMG